MNSNSTILVPNDLEINVAGKIPKSLEVASGIAASWHSEIVLLHAYELPERRLQPQILSRLEGPYLDRVTQTLESEISQVRHQNPGLRIVPKIKEGQVVETILNEVKETGCQLVVLQTHARKGLKKLVSGGSVTEEFIRRSPVPILVLNPHSEDDHFKVPRKILVATDLSEDTNAQTALLLASAQFAQSFGASLELMHVLEEWAYPIVQSMSLLAGGYVLPLEKELQEQSNNQLARLEQLCKNVRAAHQLYCGSHVVNRARSVEDAILDRANKIQADTIVVGHRHTARVEYALLGSVSRQVIKEATVPVLVVPPHYRP